MGKLDELRRSAVGNIDESMGGGAPAAATYTPRITPGPSAVPARLQGVTRSSNAVEVPVEKIAPDPDQPREEFDAGALDRLADSMKARGQLQPIRVRWDEGRGVYAIICGERRWRAAVQAGLKTMSCVITDGTVSPGELLALQLIENCVREDLRPVEQAKAFRALMDLNGWSGNHLAKELGVTQPSVVRSLALLDLPAPVQDKVEAGELPPATAYEVSKVEGAEARAELAERVVAEGLTREETAAAVKAVKGSAGSKSSRTSAGSKGRGAAKGKARKVTERVIRTGAGPRVTVEFKRGLDDALVLAALTEAADQIRGRLETAGQEAA